MDDAYGANDGFDPAGGHGQHQYSEQLARLGRMDFIAGSGIGGGNFGGNQVPPTEGANGDG